MTGLILALVGAYGVFLLYTALVLGWSGLRVSPSPIGGGRAPRRRVRQWMVQAGLEHTRAGELVAVMVVLFVVAAGLGYALFGGVAAPVAAGLGGALVPVGSARNRREQRLEEAREAWPRMIEEIRLQAVTLGRSIPQALFTVGARGPEMLRPAFAAAHREWLVSTDFDRTLAVLKSRLVDPTADAVCETLLIAHEVGGSEVDRRLRALAEDRIIDLEGRKDARSKQAGARFARRFVLVVPAGMAFVGLSIGSGRAAYRTPLGQLGVLTALALIAVCWLWAGRFMRLPTEQRVFHGDEVGR